MVLGGFCCLDVALRTVGGLLVVGGWSRVCWWLVFGFRLLRGVVCYVFALRCSGFSVVVADVAMWLV